MQRNVIEGYMLSPEQSRLWRRQGTSSAYRAQCAILVSGDLDKGRLRRAVERSVMRHEILRTTFHRLPGMEIPLQAVSDDAHLTFRETDRSQRATTDQEALMESLLAEHAQLPFDFERGPLSRFWCVELAPRKHVMLISLPSLCADACTLTNLFREVARRYAGDLDESSSGEAPVQYADFAEWRNQQTEERDGEAERRQSRGRDFSSMILAPFARKGNVAADFDPDSITFEPEPDIGAALEVMARRYDCELPALLLSCWQSLLRHLSGQRRAVVGFLFDRRRLKPLRDAMGLFAQYVAIPFELEEGSRFTELLRRTAAELSAADEQQGFHEPAPSGGQDGELSEAPFPALAFEFEEWPDDECSSDVRFSFLDRRVYTDRFKIKLCVARHRGVLRFSIQFDRLLYQVDLVHRLAEEFGTILEHVLECPEAVISELDVVGEKERHQLLVTWNDTKVDYSSELSVCELLDLEGEVGPDAVAVVCGEDQLSYGTLGRRSNQLARHIMRLGLTCESRIGLMMERSIEIVEALFGILKAGAVYVPLDPAQPRQRLELMLEDSRMSLLITQDRLLPGLPAHTPKVLCIDSEWEKIAAEDESSPGMKVSPDSLAYVIYTSGSTGTPKGVLIRHGALVNYARALRTIVYDGQSGVRFRVSLNAPLVFDASIKQLAHLLYGHTLVIIPEAARRDAEQMLGQLALHGLDVLDCTATHLKMLLAAGLGNERDLVPGRLLMGGEAVDEATWALLCEQAEMRCFNHYGPTECTVNTTICRIEDGAAPPRIGKPIANAQVFLLNGHMNPVPIGAVGELYIGGGGLARGYMNRPDWTADKFIPHPFCEAPGNRLYRSGDLARYWPDGSIEFVGRADRQVQLRGHRIELAEIETVLKEHPCIREAVVVVRADEAGCDRIIAYLLSSPASALKEEEVRPFARERLPDYMTPSAFIFLPEMPLTRNGKIDREALPSPDERSSEPAESFAPPRNMIEEVLTAIWAEVLQVNRVGLDDNFFQMGGHSLLATQLVSRVRESFRVDLPLRTLFETATVEEFALRVHEAISAGHRLQMPRIGTVTRSSQLPLSFAQQRLWFLDRLEPGNPAYHSARPLQLSGRLREPGLEQSLGEIGRRHEILRTSFPMAGDQPVQSVSPPAQLLLPMVDLGGLAEFERDATARRLVSEEAGRPFDLSRLPLFRIALLRLSDDSHTILFGVHHIVIDGWSMGILVKEVNGLYRAFCDGAPSPLPELDIQYADFACWQRDWLQGDVLEAQLSYWRRQLADATDLELPAMKARSAAQIFRGATHSVALPPGLCRALNDLSRREGVTLYMTLLAAFKILLHLYTGQEDIVVGTGIAGRSRAETEQLMGFFINMLALRTDLSGNPGFRELLARVREVALDAYAHQDVPFEKVVAELRPGWEAGRASLFNVAFFLQNFPASALDLAELSLDSWSLDPGIAHFDLMLFLMETPQGLIGGIEYSTDILDSAAIAQMSGYYKDLLEKLVADPEARLCDITLTEDELQQDGPIPPSAHSDLEQVDFRF